MAQPGFVWIEGAYIKWVDANGLVSSYVGTQQDKMAQPGFIWIQGEQVCYVDALGEVRCFSPGIAVQHFFADIFCAPVLASGTPDYEILKAAPMSTEYVLSTTPSQTVLVSATPSASVVSVLSDAQTAAPSRYWYYWLWACLTGAVSDFGGSQTNETTAANNDTANDMTLMRASPVAGDYYCFGYSATFPALWLDIGISGAGVWSTIWQYWDGDSWEDLAGVNDPSNGFRPGATGRHRIYWTVPMDWATSEIQGITAYWIRAKVDAFTSLSVQPKGTRAWAQDATDHS